MVRSKSSIFRNITKLGFIGRRKNVYKIYNNAYIHSLIYSKRDRRKRKSFLKRYYIKFINNYINYYNINYSNFCLLKHNKYIIINNNIFYLLILNINFNNNKYILSNILLYLLK